VLSPFSLVYVVTKIASLSGGRRQRVWIAMVLAQGTQHLLLEEPTYLDLASVHHLPAVPLETVRSERNSSVLIRPESVGGLGEHAAHEPTCSADVTDG
jgi:ABC-type enterochelin transport system ATPase subunit